MRLYYGRRKSHPLWPQQKILSILADIFWLRFYDGIATLRLISSFDGVHQCSFSLKFASTLRRFQGPNSERIWLLFGGYFSYRFFLFLLSHSHISVSLKSFLSCWYFVFMHGFGFLRVLCAYGRPGAYLFLFPSTALTGILEVGV